MLPRNLSCNCNLLFIDSVVTVLERFIGKVHLQEMVDIVAEDIDGAVSQMS